MKRVIPFGGFRKDLKRITKRGWVVEKLHAVVSLLQSGVQLPEKAYLHKLSGEYAGLWECHVEHDWLLIFDVDQDTVTLHRTGSHADLFE